MPAVTTFDALLSGYTWNGIEVAGRPVFLTYSFETAPAASYADDLSGAFLDSFQAFSAAEQAIARQALQAWADISGITFFEVPAGQGDIRFGLYDFALEEDHTDSVGFAFYPFAFDYTDGEMEWDEGGDVFIRIGETSFDVLVHEIGHALGLKHPFAGETTLDPLLDDAQHTVMTYNAGVAPITALGSLDVEAIQYLYGAATADGTQVAGWNWDAARYLLTQSGGPSADLIAGVSVGDRVWAGDGDDYVFTRAGEDLIDGGSGADTLAGGDGADTVHGGGGDDVIDGDPGDDLLLGDDGDDVIWGLEGADTLEGAAGDDELWGGSGLNRLIGGSGDDTLVSSLGPAIIDGGDGYDEVWLVRSSAGVGQSLAYASLNEAGGSYTGVESIVIFGSSYGDTVQGGELHDQLYGGPGADSLSGVAAGDEIFGGSGADTVSGGQGNDTIDGGSGQSYLRGDEGDDSITGGADFDDINGNIGADTASGGLGDDWVVGGKDNDQLFGDAGSDIVYGNLGDDTCSGGEGFDIVRGGQANDLVQGDAGDDWLSGDRGDDTVTGGAGADLFHTFGDAGLDRVTDFNLAEGDRVMLDPGTTYTVAQVGSDTIITMGGGGQMILAGVAMSSLTGTWIFGA